jgi:hypothetical protein
LNVEQSSNNKSYSRILIKLGIGKVIGTACLFALGVVLFTMGIYWLFIDHAGYLPLIFLGILSLVPGSYGVYEVYFYNFIFFFNN